MLPFSINTLMCKSDVHYLSGFLQSIPLGCEVNIMFTEGGRNLNPVAEPIENLQFKKDGIEKPIITRQKDKVGGMVNLYRYVYFDVNGINKFSFSDAKNTLIEQATRDWIFNIDADEVPNKNLIQNLHSILEGNPDTDMYMVARINTVKGLTSEDQIKWGWSVDKKGWVNFPDYQMRIYRRKDSIEWIGVVHERLTGYKKWSALPQSEDYCLYHPKDIDRQRKQNSFYDKIG